jgi:hypothetical protein
VKNNNSRKWSIPFLSQHSRSEGLPHSGNEMLRNFAVLGVLTLFISTLSVFAYRQFSRDATLTAAYPSTPVTPNRQLSFQGRLETAGGTPITSATNLTFKLYDAASSGTQLYSSGTCSITPDADGVFSTQIGGTCGSAIAATVFTENPNVYLEVTVVSDVLTPRQQIATVAYALNSETLQGFPISSTVSAVRNTVVPMNQWGQIVVGEQNPRLTGVSGTFQISAPSLSLTTATGTNGNITLAPDGTGQVNVNGNTTSTNFFNVSDSQLTSGSLITGTAANNNSGFKLIDLLSGSSPTSKFSVDNAGNLSTAGTTTLHGVAYTWPSADGTNTYVLQTNGAGTLSWVPQTGGGGGTNYWRSYLGSLSPLSDSYDLLLGNQATSSAKIGLININTGTPTATISGSTTGVATYLSGDGQLATTNMKSLVIGNSTTGNLNFYSSANSLTSSGNLTLAGNISLPNSASLIGDTTYLRSTTGMAFGANQTYYIDSSGNGNLNALTLASTLTLPNSNTATGVTNYLQLSHGISVGGGTTYHFDGSGNLVAANISGTSLTDSGLTQGSVVFAGTSGLLTQDNANFFWDGTAKRLGIGISGTSMLATLDLRSTLGTLPTASISGSTSMAELLVDQSGTGDLFTASKSGATQFVVTNAGNVGIGVSNPTSKLQIAGASSTISNSSGDITISPNSTNLSLAGNNITNVNNLSLSGSAYFAGGTSYYINNFGDAVFRDLVANDTGNPGLTVGDGSVGYILVGGSTVKDAGGSSDLTLTSDTSNITLNNASVTLASNGTVYGGASANDDLSISGTSNTTRTTSYLQLQSTGGFVTIGKTGGSAPKGTLDITSTLDTLPVASISGSTSMASLIVDQSGSGDLFTASKSGATKFVVTNAGNVGIGMTNPTAQLQVNADEGASTANTFYAGNNVTSTELITATNDRTFAGSGNWTGTNWAVSSGVFLHTAGNTADAVLANANLTTSSILNGRIYNVTFTVAGMTTGNLTAKLGTSAGTAITTNGTYTQAITASADNVNLIFTPTSTFDGSIDNVSVQRKSLGLLVTNTGNVGIGNLSPAYTLDVTGNIHATGNITCDGVCGDVKLDSFTTGTGGTYTMKSDAVMITVEAVGQGGGGAGGFYGATGTVRSGGGGGGGGAYMTKTLSSTEISSPVTVTISVASNKGAAGTAGTQGTASSFGSYIIARGGGGGGTSASAGGGGGGGGGETTGGTGGSSGTGGAGGGPGGGAAGAVPTSIYGGAGGGTAAATPGVGGNAILGYGGAGGGSSSSTGAAAGAAGGSAGHGGGGGGGGGTSATTCALIGGGIGGGTMYAAAATAGSGSSGAGGTGNTGNGSFGGSGGGGGANSCTTGATGGVGGAGGAPGGGGGGGGSVAAATSGTGGAGGDGGRGEVRVWTVTGSNADYAEAYATNDPTLGAGEVVALDPTLKTGVRRSLPSDDNANVIGVVSTQPAQLIGGDAAGQGVAIVPIALAGRVPVKVSAENGPILPGDYLVNSSQPGVAMKQIKAGTSIGTAIEGFDGTLSSEGLINIFVNTTYTPGLMLHQVLTAKGYSVPDAVWQSNSIDYSWMALAEMVSAGTDITNKQKITEIYGDRVAAAIEVITTRLVADKVYASNINLGNPNLATYYDSPDPLLGAGEIISLATSSGAVHRTLGSDPLMIGVVATDPGLVMGKSTLASVPVATYGQAPVKVDPHSPIIKIGDHLTASGLVAGTATKLESSSYSIGLALENWDPASPTATIKVMLNPSWYDLPGQNSLALQQILTQISNSTMALKELLASKVTTPTLQVATISPLSSGTPIVLNGPVMIHNPVATDSVTPSTPSLVVDGEIEASTISARVAKLEDVSAATISAQNIFADTISANHIEGLDAKIATLSAGLSDTELSTITDKIKSRLDALTGNLPTAADLPTPPEATASALPSPLTSPLPLDASSSASLSLLDADFVTINNYLAVVGQATITTLDVTSTLNVSTLQSKSNLLALQPLGGVINLASGTLVVDSTGLVAVSGDLSVKGKVLAQSAEFNTLELGTTPLASSAGTSTLGKLLAVYNEQGQAVATIDASGSANLASLTTQMITIASASQASSSATPSSILATNTTSNATAGNAVLTSPNTELMIHTNYDTSHTLVYLTPTGNTENKVLFVKSKNNQSFTVGIDSPATADIPFNWWIIQVK